MGGEVVIIFGFDRTLIEKDSDRWVFTNMGLTQLFRQLRPTLPWNPLMDKLLEELHIQGKTVGDIAECLKRIPMHPRVIAVIKAAHAHGCDLKVVSDSNLFYIKTILKHYGIYKCFSEITTNHAVVDKGRLRIFPYHNATASHGCDLCASNLCKGRVVEQIRASISESKSKSKRLIYIGDGMNDFCPTSKLVAGDSVMARKDFPLLGRILKNSQLVKAKVYEWNKGEDLARSLHKLIKENPVSMAAIRRCQRARKQQRGGVGPVKTDPAAAQLVPINVEAATYERNPSLAARIVTRRPVPRSQAEVGSSIDGVDLGLSVRAVAKGKAPIVEGRKRKERAETKVSDGDTPRFFEIEGAELLNVRLFPLGGRVEDLSPDDVLLRKKLYDAARELYAALCVDSQSPTPFTGEQCVPSWNIDVSSSHVLNSRPGSGGDSYELYNACQMPTDFACFAHYPYFGLEELAAQSLLEIGTYFRQLTTQCVFYHSSFLVAKDKLGNVMHEVDQLKAQLSDAEKVAAQKYEATLEAQGKKIAKLQHCNIDLEEWVALLNQFINTQKKKISEQGQSLKYLRNEVAKEVTANKKLRRAAERNEKKHAEALSKARLEGARDFKKSKIFEESVVAMATDFFEEGFKLCLDQANHASAFKDGFDQSILSHAKDADLREPTEVDEEMPDLGGEFAELAE